MRVSGVPLLLLLCAVVVWGLSLPTVDLRSMTDLGLISVFPTLYVVIAILSVSFAISVHQPRAREWLLLLHVVVLIFIVHGTPNILYGTLRYSWAWKHIGIVDYIQRHGSVDPTIRYLNPYHNWPGFFALNALITEVAGFKSALSYAGWAPVFNNLIDLGAVRLLLGTGTRDRRLIWLGIWFFFVTNWVGQDYFSPQALSYFFYLLVLGVCLTWFRVTLPPAKTTLRRWLRSEHLASLLHALLRRAASGVVPATFSAPYQRVSLMMMVILFLGVLAFTHQLTPYMLTSALAFLILFQLCSTRNLPILTFVFAVTWMLYIAIAFLKGNLHWIIQSLGRPIGTLEATFIDLSAASPGQVLVAQMNRGLTAAVIVLALLGGLRRLRHGYWDLPFALLVIAPVPMLVANAYGGEVVFRIYLFALPFLSFFAAALLYPQPTAGTSWRTIVLTVLLSNALWFGFSFGYYGKEKQYYFTPNEVAAAEFVNDTAPPGTLLMDGSWIWPLQYRNYELFQYQSIVTLPKERRSAILDDPVGTLSQLLRDSKYPAVYLIITRSQKASVDMTGWLPAGSLDRIEQALLQSPQFELLFSNEDAKVFSLPKARGTGR